MGRKTINIKGNDIYVFDKSEVEKLSFYMRDRSYKLTETVFKYLSKKEINLKNKIYISDLYTIINLIKSTDYFSFLPEFYIEENNLKDELALCGIDGEVIEWYMVFARLKNSHQPKQITQWFNKVKEFYT